MRKILEPEGDGATGVRERLHEEELYDLYCSANIFREIKSRRKSWAGHVALTVGRRVTDRVLMGKPEGNRPLGSSECRWKKILKFMFKNWKREAWDSIWLRTGTGGMRL